MTTKMSCKLDTTTYGRRVCSTISGNVRIIKTDTLTCRMTDGVMCVDKAETIKLLLRSVGQLTKLVVILLGLN